ncbi:MAG: hypothetical protein NHB32_15395 [Fischerella sp. CENA71]|nr:hypothetical protein [Fischerella sp. CENA71]
MAVFSGGSTYQAAIAVLGRIGIWIFHSMSNSSMALTEQWAVLEVSDGENMTVRQTNGNQMQVRLCGIDVLNVKQDKASGQALGNKAKEKLRSLRHKGANKLASAVEARSSGESALEGGLSQNIFNTALANLFIGAP